MLLTNLSVACMTGEMPYGLIEDGCIAIDGARVVWVGVRSDLPEVYKSGKQTDLGGRLVTPAPIDCHTHIVFGGNRAHEFEMRLQGASYQTSRARAGGLPRP